MDDALVRAALDLSGRPFLVWNVALPAPKIGTFDTELVREFFQALRDPRRDHAARRRACTAPTATTSPRPRSRPWRAPCARRSSPTRAGPTPSRRPRARCERHHADRPDRLRRAATCTRPRRRSSAWRARPARARSLVIGRPEDVARADRIVLPGDGAFPACARGAARPRRPARGDGRGGRAQGRARSSASASGCSCWRRAGANTGPRRASAGSPARWCGSRRPAGLKVPHMGWNDLVIDRPHPVLEGIATGDHAYFVHSYQMRVDDPARSAGLVRLRRRDHRHRRARHDGRHPVPPREEPGDGPPADRELPRLAPLRRPPLSAARASISAPGRCRGCSPRPTGRRPRAASWNCRSGRGRAHRSCPCT